MKNAGESIEWSGENLCTNEHSSSDNPQFGNPGEPYLNSLAISINFKFGNVFNAHATLHSFSSGWSVQVLYTNIPSFFNNPTAE